MSQLEIKIAKAENDLHIIERQFHSIERDRVAGAVFVGIGLFLLVFLGGVEIIALFSTLLILVGAVEWFVSLVRQAVTATRYRRKLERVLGLESLRYRNYTDLLD